MANDSKQVKATNEPSPFQQVLTLINKVSGEEPNLKVNVQNLKLKVANTEVTVNVQLDIGLPYPEGASAKEEK